GARAEAEPTDAVRPLRGHVVRGRGLLCGGADGPGPARVAGAGVGGVPVPVSAADRLAGNAGPLRGQVRGVDGDAGFGAHRDAGADERGVAGDPGAAGEGRAGAAGAGAGELRPDARDVAEPSGDGVQSGAAEE